MKFELQNELSDSYKMGLSLRKLSLEYKIPKSTIYYNLNKENIIRKHQKISLVKNDDLFIGTFIGFWAGDGSKFLDKRRGYIINFHVNKNDRNLIDFIKSLYKDLFDGKPKFYNDGPKNKNSGRLKINSKFLYNFIDSYLYHKNEKSYTVRLKEHERNYSRKFLNGFLLGLILSDGYLKNNFVFSTTSKKLAKNMIYIIKSLNLTPYCYKVSRNKNWESIYRIKIAKKEINDIKSILNCLIKEIDITKNFSEIKYGNFYV